jgi:antitoxin (DNA-binding transcriptional repressor) of toxin-antitoxin stability system
MNRVDIRDAEANLDRLIADAEKGRPFTISADGKPLVKVSRISPKELKRLPSLDEDPEPSPVCGRSVRALS